MSGRLFRLPLIARLEFEGGATEDVALLVDGADSELFFATEGEYQQAILSYEEVVGEDKTVDVVVDIFNRVNSGGTKLSQGDLALVGGGSIELDLAVVAFGVIVSVAAGVAFVSRQ